MVRTAVPPRTLSPRRQVAFARQHRTSSVLFLFGLLVAIDLLRRGFPRTAGAADRYRILGYAGAALSFMILSSIAPEFATILLSGVLVIVAMRAAPDISAWGKQLGDYIARGSAAAAAPRSPTSPVPV